MEAGHDYDNVKPGGSDSWAVNYYSFEDQMMQENIDNNRTAAKGPPPQIVVQYRKPENGKITIDSGKMSLKSGKLTIK